MNHISKAHTIATIVMDRRGEGKPWPKAGKRENSKKPRWSDLEEVYVKRWGEQLPTGAASTFDFIDTVMRGLKRD